MFVHKELDEFPKPPKYTPYLKSGFNNVDRLGHCNTLIDNNLKVCKIIILGDLCVGKTSLLNRFCHKVFDCNYRTTIGVDFQTEQINILGVPYHLQIWDTAGQERFKCISQCYYRKAHVIMLVFDLSSVKTLINCKNWLRDALEVATDADAPYVFLVGTKKDLISEESYNSIEQIAETCAKDLNAEFWNVSSKSGDNIDEMFFRAAALCFDDHVAKITSEIETRNIQIGGNLIDLQKHEKRKHKCESFACGSAVK